MRQTQALHIMLSGQSVFLTGAPGAGKTFVLNRFIQLASLAGKRTAITASTGIAATHIGGTTIHSWSGLGIRDRLGPNDRQWLKGNDRLKKRYNSVDVLIIDEISMLHGARLDMVNEACKLLRENEQPFGGLQVILVGDLFQLPPVNRMNELVDFAHTSAAWIELDPRICYITEQHRQTEDALLDLLTAMRSGDLDQMHIETLQSRQGLTAPADQPLTRLYTHNVDVDSINQRHLRAITEQAKTFTMQAKGAGPKIEQLAKSVLAPEELVLKVGAEVMFVANDFAQGFVNGSRGQVTGFSDGLPLVRLLSGRTVKVEPHSWTLMEDDRKRAEVSQLPLRLAWAITIHKSQGMSLDAAEIDLTKAFTPGMGYVALSRLRSLDGMYLTGLNNMSLQLHPDIYEFDRSLQQASAMLSAATPDLSEAEMKPPTMAERVDTTSDESLLQALKVWRLDRAHHDKVAPFMIAHNATLEAIAANPPLTSQQLLGIKGFGPAKLEQYGPEILRLMQQRHAAQSTDSTEALPALETVLEMPLQALREANHQLMSAFQARQEVLSSITTIRSAYADAARDVSLPAPTDDEARQAGLSPQVTRQIFSLLDNDKL